MNDQGPPTMDDDMKRVIAGKVCDCHCCMSLWVMNMRKREIIEPYVQSVSLESKSHRISMSSPVRTHHERTVLFQHFDALFDGSVYLWDVELLCV
jgi:hypothetical protein